MGDIGYVATDIDSSLSSEAVAQLEAMEPTIRVRVLDPRSSL